MRGLRPNLMHLRITSGPKRSRGDEAITKRGGRIMKFTMGNPDSGLMITGMYLSP